MADPISGFTLAQQGTNLSATGTSPSQPNPAANTTNPSQPALSPTSLRYPFAKLTNTDDYLKIGIMDYEPPGFSDASFVQPTADQQYGTSNIRCTILLPIPQSVKSPNATSWNDDTLGPVEVLGLGVAGALLEGKTGSLSKALDTASDALQSASVVKGLKAQFAQKAVRQLTGQSGAAAGTTGALGRTTGAVFNSNIELLFQGVGLRESFSFSYDLIPRSQREALEIKEIIKTFKREMAGKKGGAGNGAGIFLKAPSVFKLQYKSGNKDHPFLNRFKMCALTSMSVDYTGSGTYATYSDATPVHIKLDLSFKELTPIYAEDYNTEEGKLGTGY